MQEQKRNRNHKLGRETKMDIKKEAENLVKNVDKEDVKKVVNQALDSKVADDVIEKINDKTKTVDIKLAENGTYVNSWQWADLSSLGKVVKLEFVFTGSDNGDYGVNTPAYICIDDMAIEK